MKRMTQEPCKLFLHILYSNIWLCNKILSCDFYWPEMLQPKTDNVWPLVIMSPFSAKAVRYSRLVIYRTYLFSINLKIWGKCFLFFCFVLSSVSGFYWRKDSSFLDRSLRLTIVCVFALLGNYCCPLGFVSVVVKCLCLFANQYLSSKAFSVSWPWA